MLAIKLAIENLLRTAQQSTNHVHTFLESVDDWCEQTKQDQETWRAKAWRILHFKKQFPYSSDQKIVAYVLEKDNTLL